MSFLNKPVLLIAILILCLADAALARDKTDTVVLANGDHITGEIKSLERGLLRLSTDSMGTVNIEWDEIQKIESQYVFQFERIDGTRVTGRIQESTDDGSITLQSGLGRVTFAHERVVRIAQIEDSFWDSMDGSFSLGYSFTRASDVTQFNLGFRTTHRTEARAYSAEGSTIITDDQLGEETSRSTLQFAITRFRQNRWFSTYFLGFESNDELGLDLRSSIGGGFGRYFVQTNTDEFSGLLGLIGAAENLDPVEDIPGEPEGDSRQNNLEGLIGLQYVRYIFDEPTLDLNVRAQAFPSLTDWGRVRTQLDISLRWEMIDDLFWDLTYYNTYDSDPPSGSEATSDYGIVTSLGYSF